MFVQIQNYNVPVLSAELQLFFKGAKAKKVGGCVNYV